MTKMTVRDIMVPLDEYATIHQHATLFDAVLALEKAQQEYSQPGAQYKHRAILVFDDKKKVIGKLSQLDILISLEPKYRRALDGDGRIMASGFSQEFLRSMVKQFALWDKPLIDICKKATEMKAKDCMYVPEPGEYVDIDDSLDMAMHQLVVGHHQSLLVTENGNIVGILRLTDVFNEIVSAMKACNL